MEYYDVGFRIINFGHKNPRLSVLVDELGIRYVAVLHVASYIT
jgi:hypothetical protein